MDWWRGIWAWQPIRESPFEAARAQLLWRGLMLLDLITATSALVTIVVAPAILPLVIAFVLLHTTELVLIRRGFDRVAIALNVLGWFLALAVSWGPTYGLGGTLPAFLVVGVMFCAAFLDRVSATLAVAAQLLFVLFDDAVMAWAGPTRWVEPEQMLTMHVTGEAIAILMATGLVGTLLETLGRVERDAAGRAELATEAQARAVDAAEAKSRFLATMSHELRTPLNAILGYSDLLLEDRPGVAELERIRDSGAHLLELVGDVLEVARAESSTPQPATCGVAEAAAALGASVVGSGAEATIAVSLDVVMRALRNLGAGPGAVVHAELQHGQGDDGWTRCSVALFVPDVGVDSFRLEIASRLGAAHGGRVELTEQGEPVLRVGAA